MVKSSVNVKYYEIVHGNQGRLLGIAIGTRPKPVPVPRSPWAMPPRKLTFTHNRLTGDDT